MKILLISSEFPPGPGGIGRHAFSLVKVLKPRHDLTVVSNQDWAEEAEKIEFKKDELKGISFKKLIGRNIPGYRIWRVAQVITIALKFRPAQIILTGKYSLWIGYVLKKLQIKANYTGFVHGSEVGQLKGDKLTQRSLNALDRIVAVSKFTKTLIVSCITDASKIQVVPNGIDADFLKAAKSKSERLTWEGKPRLLTVGNLTQRKGQHRVIKALSTLRMQFHDVHYHMVGLPTQQTILEQLALELEVRNLITFHGRLPGTQELRHAYASADIFIMLSENQPNGDVEGFGIAILEANAFGIPTIGAKGCGIEDAISEDSGILVDGNNPVEITQAVQAIMNNYERYSRGAILWAEKHKWNNLINEILV